jgi:hypothetical protein
MALNLPLCIFNRHTPNRHRVKWDGLNFVGTCRFCKSPIRKIDRRGWRKEWMSDAHLAGPLVGKPPAAEQHQE